MTSRRRVSRADDAEGKGRLVPLCFGAPNDPDLLAQVGRLRELLADEAEILDPLPLGSPLPPADAVLLPQLVGDAFSRAVEIAALPLPIVVITSEFGTMAMWDWEIVSYLRGRGLHPIAPYSVDQAKTVCRALAARRQLGEGSFLVYQDEPGVGGFQPEIFRRFFWWQDECTQRIKDAYGLTITKRSFAELGARAKAVSDADAIAELERLRDAVPFGHLDQRATLSTLKLYRCIREDVESEGNVLGAGINCLNESSFSDTTPCLAWSLLYQERDLIWGCEADTMAMLTKYILHRSLRTPIMMTNLYPFLMGDTALKHERIPAFPEVDEPANYVLAGHCGYLGVVPQSFATTWTMRRKVLAIVDDNAAVIDARLPVGDLTLSKLDPTLEALTVVEGRLTGYAGYPGSDCRNGAVIRVPNGHALMQRLPSHHSLLTTGHDLTGIRLTAQIFGLRVDVI